MAGLAQELRPYVARRCAMTLMDRYTQPDLETRDTSNARERLTAAA